MQEGDETAVLFYSSVAVRLNASLLSHLYDHSPSFILPLPRTSVIDWAGRTQS